MISQVFMSAGKKVGCNLGSKFLTGFGATITNSVIINKLNKKAEKNITNEQNEETIKKKKNKLELQKATASGLTSVVFGAIAFGASKLINNL